MQIENLVKRCLGKKCQLAYNKRKKGEADHCVWKKRSIFFTLLYWEYHKLRHNLDVMHIEKNVISNILSTLLNLKEQTKNNYKACLDFVNMGIRNELHLYENVMISILTVCLFSYDCIKEIWFLTSFDERKSARWIHFQYLTLCQSKRTQDFWFEESQ